MARQQTQYPVRRVAVAGFSPDDWALDGEQSRAEAPSPILIATAPTVLWTLIPMDGMGDDAEPVSDPTTTVDVCLVNILRTQSGAYAYSRSLSLAECLGSEQTTGRTLIDQATIGDLLALGIRTLTPGVATALWIYAEGVEVVA